MATPTLIHTGEQLEGTASETAVFGVPHGGWLRRTHGGRCLSAQPLCCSHLKRTLSPLAGSPTTGSPSLLPPRFSSKMGETRWNLHHQKYPKTSDFTRTARSLCQLKLGEWQLRSPDAPPPPSTQHSTNGNHHIWPSDNRGPPPIDISLKSIS